MPFEFTLIPYGSARGLKGFCSITAPVVERDLHVVGLCLSLSINRDNNCHHGCRKHQRTHSSSCSGLSLGLSYNTNSLHESPYALAVNRIGRHSVAFERRADDETIGDFQNGADVRRIDSAARDNGYLACSGFGGLQVFECGGGAGGRARNNDGIRAAARYKLLDFDPQFATREKR